MPGQRALRVSDRSDTVSALLEPGRQREARRCEGRRHPFGAAAEATAVTDGGVIMNVSSGADEGQRALSIWRIAARQSANSSRGELEPIGDRPGRNDLAIA